MTHILQRRFELGSPSRLAQALLDLIDTVEFEADAR